MVDPSLCQKTLSPGVQPQAPSCEASHSPGKSRVSSVWIPDIPLGRLPLGSGASNSRNVRRQLGGTPELADLRRESGQLHRVMERRLLFGTGSPPSLRRLRGCLRFQRQPPAYCQGHQPMHSSGCPYTWRQSKLPASIALDLPAPEPSWDGLSSSRRWWRCLQ